MGQPLSTEGLSTAERGRKEDSLPAELGRPLRPSAVGAPSSREMGLRLLQPQLSWGCSLQLEGHKTSGPHVV